MCRLTALLALLVLAAPVAAGSVLISEVLADPVGRDDGGVFVELHGPAFASLTGYVLEARNGSGGSITHEVSLTGLVFPEDGFLVIADGRAGVTTVADADLVVEDFDLQNGPESLRLLRGDTVVDALAYGTFGPGHAWFGEGEPARTGPSGTSLARRYANIDTDDNGVDFILLEAPTPGWGPLLPPDVEPEPVPIPEPASSVLLTLGFATVVLITRRPRSGRPSTRTRRRCR